MSWHTGAALLENASALRNDDSRTLDKQISSRAANFARAQQAHGRDRAPAQLLELGASAKSQRLQLHKDWA
eukprot:scaffold32639_cov112-Isochrysis_galbana.AAC.5